MLIQKVHNHEITEDDAEMNHESTMPPKIYQLFPAIAIKSKYPKIHLHLK